MDYRNRSQWTGQFPMKGVCKVRVEQSHDDRPFIVANVESEYPLMQGGFVLKVLMIDAINHWCMDNIGIGRFESTSGLFEIDDLGDLAKFRLFWDGAEIEYDVDQPASASKIIGIDRDGVHRTI